MRGGIRDIKPMGRRISVTYSESIMILSKHVPITDEAALIVALLFERDPEDVLRDLKQGAV